MTADPDPRHEARLKELFDTSAAQASGPTLTKLRARAAEVPNRSPRAPRWLPRWAWSPLLAGLAVGVGALGVTIGVWLNRPETAAPGPGPEARVSAEPQANVPAPSPLAASSSRTPRTAGLEDEQLDEGAELAEFGFGDDSYLDVDALDDPGEDEIDAWWEATADLVEGGG